MQSQMKIKDELRDEGLGWWRRMKWKIRYKYKWRWRMETAANDVGSCIFRIASNKSIASPSSESSLRTGIGREQTVSEFGEWYNVNRPCLYWLPCSIFQPLSRCMQNYPWIVQLKLFEDTQTYLLTKSQRLSMHQHHQHDLSDSMIGSRFINMHRRLTLWPQMLRANQWPTVCPLIKTALMTTGCFPSNTRTRKMNNIWARINQA